MRHARYPLAASFHEAGHAVAAAAVGAPFADTEVFADGRGFHEHSWDNWNIRAKFAGRIALWELLLVLMAGSHAEARASKHSYRQVCMSHGQKGYLTANVLIEIMVERGHVTIKRAAWKRADAERADFLRQCWPIIEAVAARLAERGIVRAGELRQICRRARIV